MNAQTFVGATVYLPGEIVQTSVTVAGGKITDIGGPVQGDEIDAKGMILAPALIDVHGDAFERQLMPRSGVFVPIDLALLETDRQLAVNGIATTYHSLTLSWEPGLRSVDRGRDVIEALTRLAPRFTVENRVQLRWETFAFEAMDLIKAALNAPLTPSLAFNDHTSMVMRDFDVAIQDREFELSDAFAIADIDDPRMDMRLQSRAVRANIPFQEYRELLRNVWARRSDQRSMMPLKTSLKSGALQGRLCLAMMTQRPKPAAITAMLVQMSRNFRW